MEPTLEPVTNGVRPLRGGVRGALERLAAG
jgi:hypothetical protein